MQRFCYIDFVNKILVLVADNLMKFIQTIFILSKRELSELNVTDHCPRYKFIYISNLLAPITIDSICTPLFFSMETCYNNLI